MTWSHTFAIVILVYVSYIALVPESLHALLPARDSEDMDQSHRRISLSHLGNHQSFAWPEHV